MAQGKTSNMSVAEVCSISHSLETSPSKTSPSSPIYSGGSKATGRGAGESTAKLKHGTTRPKPRGTRVEGKKNLMSGKTRGR
jgi:hypothetical protein